MKFIPLPPTQSPGNIEPKAFLVGMLETSPGGQSVGEMRKRLVVIEKIQAASDGVTLEDAEHQTLVQVLNSRSDFVVTRRDIIAIVDSVMEAKAPAA